MNMPQYILVFCLPLLLGFLGFVSSVAIAPDNRKGSWLKTGIIVGAVCFFVGLIPMMVLYYMAQSAHVSMF